MSTAADPLAEIKARVQMVGLDRAREEIAAGTKLIDVREQHEWDESHLESAVHVPLGELLERLDEVAVDVAAALREEGAGGHILGDEQMVVDALDDLVRSDVERRLDHWRDTIEDSAWDELTEYLTWWVVKGYALRVAETLTGALA